MTDFKRLSEQDHFPDPKRPHAGGEIRPAVEGAVASTARPDRHHLDAIRQVAATSPRLRRLDAIQRTVDQSERIDVQRRYRTANRSDAPVQRRLLLDSDDSRQLTPASLAELEIPTPQLYKDLFYALDDHDANFPVKSDTPGNFEPATKTISVPPYGLEYPAKRIRDKAALESDRPPFHTAMAQFGHEMQHAYDYVLGNSKGGMEASAGSETKYLAVMDTELRAWASEAIIYKAGGETIQGPGKELLAGWSDFSPAQIDRTDAELQKNAIWARIIKYSTANKIGQHDWKTCARTGDLLSRAAEEKKRVEEHVDAPRPTAPEVTIDNAQALPDALKNAGNRITKVERAGDYRVYLFRRQRYKIHKDVVGAGTWFEQAAGSFV